MFLFLRNRSQYQQLEVTEKSQQYLTINTSKGLFRFTRLPFGVASAPSIFQSVMDRILHGIPKVACYLDDILIGARNREECKERLFEVMTRLQHFNVKINMAKCLYLSSEIEYLG
jgi:Reverse transcriptase (RNA-dependent DNA polymerase)